MESDDMPRNGYDIKTSSSVMNGYAWFSVLATCICLFLLHGPLIAAVGGEGAVTVTKARIIYGGCFLICGIIAGIGFFAVAKLEPKARLRSMLAGCATGFGGVAVFAALALLYNEVWGGMGFEY